MKIIITDFFEKILHKKVKNINISEIISKLNIYSKNFIWLKVPFYKVKLKIWNKSYRLLLFSDQNFVKLLFINIYDKKDKLFWENISWKISEDEIIKFYNKNLLFLEKKKFKVYNEKWELI